MSTLTDLFLFTKQCDKRNLQNTVKKINSFVGEFCGVLHIVTKKKQIKQNKKQKRTAALLTVFGAFGRSETQRLS